MPAPSIKVAPRRLVSLTLLGWLSMLAVDFFLHAGLLARLYTEQSPFLLPPLEAFIRIPLGYLSFLLLGILLVWLMARLRVAGWLPGLWFGAKLGALVWGSFALGLLSISTASVPLMAGWFAGQTVELAVAGAVVGGGLAGTAPRRLALLTAVLLVVAFVVTVAMQALGLAPPAARF